MLTVGRVDQLVFVSDDLRRKADCEAIGPRIVPSWCRRVWRSRRGAARAAGLADLVWRGDPPPADRPRLGTVARLVPVKDLELFVDVVRRVRDEVPDLRAAVVGDGPEAAALQRYADEAGLSETLTWSGEVRPGSEAVAEFDVFLLTSQAEGVPVSVSRGHGGGAAGGGHDGRRPARGGGGWCHRVPRIRGRIARGPGRRACGAGDPAVARPGAEIGHGRGRGPTGGAGLLHRRRCRQVADRLRAVRGRAAIGSAPSPGRDGRAPRSRHRVRVVPGLGRPLDQQAADHAPAGGDEPHPLHRRTGDHARAPQSARALARAGGR